jgi:hypothetical protein
VRPLEIAADILLAGQPLRFRALGGSMRPIFPPGTVVTVLPASLRPPREGDVVLARGGAGPFVHRILSRRKKDGETAAWLTRGDASPSPDPEVRAADVLGVVVRAERHGALLDLEWPPARLLVRLLLRLYRLRMRLRG